MHDAPLTVVVTLDNPDEDPIDTQGHGTHVAGTIAGKTAK
jgi:subtilisin family serine protease